MTYTKGTSNRHTLDTVDSLKLLLDYAVVNGGYANIELDIDSLYFKHNFCPLHSQEISFTYFTKPVTNPNAQAEADRHTNALYHATAALGAELHPAANIAEAARICVRDAFVATLKLVYCQAANVAKFRRAKALYQAEWVKTTKLVFLHAAETARICYTNNLYQDEYVTTSNLVFREAADPHRV